MSKPRASFQWMLAGGLVTATVALSGCSASPSVLDPVSSDATRINRLWWVMLGISAAVFAVVLFFMVGAVLRRDRKAQATETRFGPRLVMWGGLIVPAFVLAGVFVLSAIDLQALAAGDESADLEIVVTGQQWWWQIEYPQSGVVTANEIHVPAGEEVRFVLEAGDVIHSFWVPQAGPKRDMIPGRTNELVLSFDRAGTYQGICSEFCGLQHAKMQFHVVAQPRDQFEQWLDGQSRTAPEPTGDAARGLEIFLASPCVGCHTIRGVSEAGGRGPDLTHLASRETIGGGVIDLTTANLHDWVRNPDLLKPGVLMPPSQLPDDAIDDLVAYLETLR